MADVIVIGGGIMGSTIAAWLRRNREVLLIDDARPETGTNASGGLIKPSKLTGLDMMTNGRVVKVMDHLFGVTPERFILRPSFDLLKMDIHRVDMDRVRAVARIEGRVSQIRRGRSLNTVLWQEGPQECTAQAPFIVLCCGFWCGELLPGVFPPGTLTAKKGISFRFAGRIAENFVQAWAPYKQITVHNSRRNGVDEIWAGDGTALKPENWAQERETQSLKRIRDAVMGLGEVTHTTRGLRPFHKDGDKPCYLREVADGIWVATGAGKFGGIAAAWAALQLDGELI